LATRHAALSTDRKDAHRLAEAIIELAKQYGYRRITALLQPNLIDEYTRKSLAILP
jgi:hypothetical protein